MSLVVQITQDDRATPFVRRIGAELNAPEVKRVMGRAIVPVVKSNFEALNAQSNNPLGHSGYYLKAARSVHQPDLERDGFSIAIGQVGVGLHYFGGTVKAGKSISKRTGRPTQYLTIPARSEAYAHRADEFPNLKILFGRGGQPVALVERDDAPSTESQVVTSRNGVKRRVKTVKAPAAAGGIVMFWLVRQVVIKENKDVLPKREAMTTPAFEAAVVYLGRIAARASEGGSR